MVLFVLQSEIRDMITSWILSYLWAFLIPIMIAVAIYARLFIPVFGKAIFVVLLCSSAAYGSYELGYWDRAKLDKSAQLADQLAIANAQVVQAAKNAQSNKTITEDANARELLAEKTAGDLQTKVTEYEKTLIDNPPVVQADTQTVCAAVREVSSCRLSAADVAGLRAIRADRLGKRPARAP